MAEQTGSYASDVSSGGAVDTDTYSSGMYVFLQCITTGVYFAQGITPTATTDDLYLPAGAIVEYYVKPGNAISFLGDSATTGRVRAIISHRDV